MPRTNFEGEDVDICKNECIIGVMHAYSFTYKQMSGF